MPLPRRTLGSGFNPGPVSKGRMGLRTTTAGGAPGGADQRRQQVYRDDVPHAGVDGESRPLPPKGTPERAGLRSQAVAMRLRGMTHLAIGAELCLEPSSVRILLKECLGGE